MSAGDVEMDLLYYKNEFEIANRRAAAAERRVKELEADIVSTLKKLDSISMWLQMGLEEEEDNG